MAGRPLNRQNEYFVPRDGIDREVITADICRYLGNDALVRPGTYESKETGQLIQGYYINAYRNLTTAMIEDLKEASRQWAQERTRVNGAYRHSETHQRQQGGMTGDPQYGQGGGFDPRFPQPTPTVFQPPQQNYPPQSGAYSGNQPNYQHQAQGTYSPPPPQMDAFRPPPPPTQFPPAHQHQHQHQHQQFVEPPYQAGGNLRAAPVYGDQPQDRNVNVNYGGPSRVPQSTMPPQQPGYAASAPGQAYYSQGPAPQGGFVPQNQVQPQDPFLGRRPYSGPGKEQPFPPPEPYEDQSGRTVTPTGGVPQSAPPAAQRPRERDSKHHHRTKYS